MIFLLMVKLSDDVIVSNPSKHLTYYLLFIFQLLFKLYLCL